MIDDSRPTIIYHLSSLISHLTSLLIPPDFIFAFEPFFNQFGGNRLGALERKIKDTVPAKTGQHTQGPAYPEQYRVELVLHHTIMYQKGPAMGIHIGPGV